MPEAVCADVARELLKKLAFASVRDGGLVNAVRALKAFRAVNVTFCEAFEENKAGCKILARLTLGLIREQQLRVAGIDNLMALHDRESQGLPARRTGQGAIRWIRELRRSLQRDACNHKLYLAALTCSIDRCALHDCGLLRRAALPVAYIESLANPGGGLPRGPWCVRASRNRLAPHGTCAWLETLLMNVKRDERVQRVDHGEWAGRTAALILGITRAQEGWSVQQFIASVAEMLRRLGDVGAPAG